MASDYAAIRADNERRYGTDIGRIGPMLLSDRYDDRTHFIFELLQNAEDALASRPGWDGSRSVRFRLTVDELRVSHFGKPFDEADVRGICGIDESTKKLTEIGRFGIGFKSVYAFTDRPSIHSGSEDFGIESFVWPTEAPAVARKPDETVIIIPLRSEHPDDREEISAGLQRLGARTLLFLRQVEEIEWSAGAEVSGIYLRSQPEFYEEEKVRRVTLLGQAQNQPDVEEDWLVFSRPVAGEGDTVRGNVEVAFLIEADAGGHEQIQPVPRSPLVAYFPTVLETHLGILLQGPYRTTPSRDNVPRHDSWNRRCVDETSRLLADALRWLRDNSLLDTGALQTLPLESDQFGADSMFEPLFRATRALLASEELLPRFGGGYTAASNAKLARTQDLRELFGPLQLATLFDADQELAWLSGDISPDRTPGLRQYLMRELDIGEVTPESILPRLTEEYLCAQPDGWMVRLYEFLNGQPALHARARDIPLVRLDDGSHVPAILEGQPQAFLPGEIESGFPTVRSSVCSSDDAREYLGALGLTEPDPVDDVVWNVLPRYARDEVAVSDDVYDSDVRRIVAAFASDSTAQRDRLVEALGKSPFVAALETGKGQECMATPGEVYLATERLKWLFEGVPDVLLADVRHSCLRGEEIREVLKASGAVRYLRPVADASMSAEERRRLREQAGHVKTSRQNDRVVDHKLLGLGALLTHLPQLPAEDRRTRAGMLWEELSNLEERRGKGIFTGEYTWTHYGKYGAPFDAAFVRLLNRAEWVPDADDHLRRPDAVLFDSLGWKSSPFLLSKIRFKPPIIDQLAKEAGFEPGVLDLLRQRGITSAAQLREILGVAPEDPSASGGAADVDDALEKLIGDVPAPTSPVSGSAGVSAEPMGGGGLAAPGGSDTGSVASRTGSADSDRIGVRRREEGPSTAGRTRTPGSAGARPFISYVAVSPEEEPPDPDRLSQDVRMRLEATAIELILEREPDWRRTPPSNPGFDLFQAGPDGEAARWCEVKAMTGSLDDRPIGLSSAQFQCAREHGEAYWLYVVEQTGTSKAHIVRIQDPAGNARTFTFDHGWRAIAAVASEQEDRED